LLVGFFCLFVGLISNNGYFFSVPLAGNLLKQAYCLYLNFDSRGEVCRTEIFFVVVVEADRQKQDMLSCPSVVGEARPSSR